MQKPESPPYVSFKTLLKFLEWLREDGVPTRLDRTFWGERLSGAYGFQMMGGFRFLDLIDQNNRPQPDLELMAQDRESRRDIIGTRLVKCYHGALRDLDLERASMGELQERFRVYHIEGETLRKALAFFIHAAEYCGLPLSPYITKGTRTVKRADATRKRTRPIRKPVSIIEPQHEPAAAEPARLPYDLHPCIQGLLTDLVELGHRWTRETRERWMSTFISNIDYVYPTRDND